MLPQMDFPSWNQLFARLEPVSLPVLPSYTFASIHKEPNQHALYIFQLCHCKAHSTQLAIFRCRSCTVHNDCTVSSLAVSSLTWDLTTNAIFWRLTTQIHIWEVQGFIYRPGNRLIWLGISMYDSGAFK
jgi:hypothetical protein